MGDWNLTVIARQCYPESGAAAARQQGDFYFIAENHWTMGDICRRINYRMLWGRLRILRIWAHGVASYIELGQVPPGLVTENATTFSMVRRSWVDPMTRQVQPFPLIEVHACEAAASTAHNQPTPRVILQRLANATGVSVRAGENLQRVSDGFQFTGPVLTIRPARPSPIRSTERPDVEDELATLWHALPAAEREAQLTHLIRTGPGGRFRAALLDQLARLAGRDRVESLLRQLGIE